MCGACNCDHILFIYKPALASAKILAELRQENIKTIRTQKMAKLIDLNILKLAYFLFLILRSLA